MKVILHLHFAHDLALLRNLLYFLRTYSHTVCVVYHLLFAAVVFDTWFLKC